MINLKNKKVLITGATGGIGNSLVKKFHESRGPDIGLLLEQIDEHRKFKKNFTKI